MVALKNKILNIYLRNGPARGDLSALITYA
jgi:hypothetical protein